MTGTVETLAPGLRRVRAPNPSPMTYTGTNTYVVGDKDVAVIDPGPDDIGHLKAILSALPVSSKISHILVTHAHRDHSALAPKLAELSRAPILAAGGYAERRRPIMNRIANSGLVGGGEGVDAEFTPDLVLEDCELIATEDWELEVVATPGHMADHLSFVWKDMVFTGDHVMDWASSLVSPPDGDLTSFLGSCEKLSCHAARMFLPGHGPPVAEPAKRLDWLIKHRKMRDEQIRQTLQHTDWMTIEAIALAIYADVAPALLPAAGRNVLAHLIAGCEVGVIMAEPNLSATAKFSLA